MHTLDMKKFGEHGSLGRTSKGEDALYQVTFDPAPDGCNGDPDRVKFLDGEEKATTFFNEIYLVNTDPSNTEVCRVAHHRSTGKLAQSELYSAYFGEPHVTISPSGTRLLYGSDWYDSGSVDSYVVELPGYKRP